MVQELIALRSCKVSNKGLSILYVCDAGEVVKVSDEHATVLLDTGCFGKKQNNQNNQKKKGDNK